MIPPDDKDEINQKLAPDLWALVKKWHEEDGYTPSMIVTTLQRATVSYLKSLSSDTKTLENSGIVIIEQLTKAFGLGCYKIPLKEDK